MLLSFAHLYNQTAQVLSQAFRFDYIYISYYTFKKAIHLSLRLTQLKANGNDILLQYSCRLELISADPPHFHQCSSYHISIYHTAIALRSLPAGILIVTI